MWLSQHADEDGMRDTLRYSDAWFPDATRTSTDAVDVEVWVEIGSPTLAMTLDRIQQVEDSLGEIPVEWHFRALNVNIDSLEPSLALSVAGDLGYSTEFLTNFIVLSGEEEGVLIAARESGMDMAMFSERMGHEQLKGRVFANAQVAQNKGVRNAPTWFVEGYRLRGLQSASMIARVIKQEGLDWRTVQER